jgi:hypothetical protein
MPDTGRATAIHSSWKHAPLHLNRAEGLASSELNSRSIVRTDEARERLGIRRKFEDEIRHVRRCVGAPSQQRRRIVNPSSGKAIQPLPAQDRKERSSDLNAPVHQLLEDLSPISNPIFPRQMPPHWTSSSEPLLFPQQPKFPVGPAGASGDGVSSQNKLDTPDFWHALLSENVKLQKRVHELEAAATENVASWNEIYKNLNDAVHQLYLENEALKEQLADKDVRRSGRFADWDVVPAHSLESVSSCSRDSPSTAQPWDMAHLLVTSVHSRSS